MIPLTAQDLQFLNTNYLVHDPIKKTTSKDFSRLGNCKVLLIGEIHNCSILQQNAERLIQITAKGKSCLLVEHLTPGIKVDKDRVALYKKLPANIDVQGGDLLGLNNLTQFYRLKGLLQELSNAKSVHATAYAEKLSSVAERLNSLLRDETLYVEGRKIRVKEGHWKELEQLCSINCLDELEWEYNRVLQPNPQLAKLLHRYRLIFSIDGLAEEIKKTATVFDRVVVVWDRLCLVGNDYLLQKLRNMEVIVLLPARELTYDFLCQSPDEIDAAKDLTILFERCGVSPNEEKEMRVHKKFLSHLNPAFHSAVSCNSELPINITPQELCLRLEGANHFVLAPNTPYCFVGVDFLFTAKLLDKITFDNRISSTIFKQVFNRFMFKEGLSFVSAHIGNGEFEATLHARNAQTCLNLKAEEEVILEFSKNYFSVDVYYFLEMAAERVFTLPQGKRLELTLVSSEDRGFLTSGKESIEVVLTKYVPEGVQVRVEGSYSFEVNKDLVFYSNGDVKFHIEPMLPINITPQELCLRLEGANHFVLAPNTPYCFVGVDFLFTAKLLDKITFDNRISSTIFKQVFNRFMFKEGLSFVSAHIGNGEFEATLHARNAQTCLNLKAEEEVILEFSKNYFSVDVYYFLEMAAERVFTLPQGKRLELTLVSSEDRGFLTSGKESIEVVLTKYVPEGVQVRVEGSYSFEVNKDLVFYSNGDVKFHIEPIVK